MFHDLNGGNWLAHMDGLGKVVFLSLCSRCSSSMEDKVDIAFKRREGGSGQTLEASHSQA